MDNLWETSELEYLGHCPVCENGSRVLAHQGLQDRLFRSSGDCWNLYACQACGTHYVDPRPKKESIGRAYATYLTHQSPTANKTREGRAAQQRVMRVLRALANGYRNARWGTRLEPQLALGRYLLPCIPLLQAPLVDQLRSLPRHSGDARGPGARLLDVGCGNGAFLQLARSAGWSVKGIDFDSVAVEHARSSGLDVTQGGLEQLQAAESESFGRVTLSHVLEHVHEPLLWLEELHRLVHPGGTLWLQTPNIASLGHARYSDNWRGLEPPRHLTLWTLDTLRQTLKKVGFREVRALRTPVLSAMEMYASSEALRRGMDHASFTALPGTQRRHIRYLWPALLQHVCLRRCEFHTLIATR